MHSAITNYIDVAQLVLYAFWVFFAGLIVYLRREDKREGYPLESSRTARTNRIQVQGFPRLPAPKLFRLPGGGTASAPNNRAEPADIRSERTGNWPGAPYEPTGNPMLSGAGPAAYAQRADEPDLTDEGHPRIVPMRVTGDFTVERRDIDPRGLPVYGADGKVGGIVHDVWVDRAEPQIRFLEVSVDVAGATRQVLLPIGFTRFDLWRRCVRVNSILSHQFADVPACASPDRVTRLEEDRIAAYYAGGTLYAEPSRIGPLL
jgi:photosynthetic reaction center H subunit